MYAGVCGNDEHWDAWVNRMKTLRKPQTVLAGHLILGNEHGWGGQSFKIRQILRGAVLRHGMTIVTQVLR
jgi:hypothetical protein